MKKNMVKCFAVLTMIIFVSASVPVVSANSIEVKSIYKFIKRFSYPLSNILTIISSMTNYPSNNEKVNTIDKPSVDSDSSYFNDPTGYLCDDENWNPYNKPTLDPDDLYIYNPSDDKNYWEKRDRPDI